MPDVRNWCSISVAKRDSSSFAWATTTTALPLGSEAKILRATCLPAASPLRMLLLPQVATLKTAQSKSSTQSIP